MADKDELVPYEHMQELVKKSTGNSVFIHKFIVKGANHNDGFIRDTKGYTDNLRNFINEVLENYWRMIKYILIINQIIKD